MQSMYCHRPYDFCKKRVKKRVLSGVAAVCSYFTHLWCSYLSPKTGISVCLFDAFVVFLFEPGPDGGR